MLVDIAGGTPIGRMAGGQIDGDVRPKTRERCAVIGNSFLNRAIRRAAKHNEALYPSVKSRLRVELGGFEPPTSSLRTRRSAS
jgi:hypothetical protein